jgi:hypothetical protein
LLDISTMVSLAVEEVDEGTGRLSSAGNSGRGWLEGGGQRRRALPGSAPITCASAAAGFWSGPAATKNHHWQENWDEIIIIEIEVKAPEADAPVAGFVDFARSGKAIVEISNNNLAKNINELIYYQILPVVLLDTGSAPAE